MGPWTATIEEIFKYKTMTSNRKKWIWYLGVLSIYDSCSINFSVKKIPILLPLLISLIICKFTHKPFLKSFWSILTYSLSRQHCQRNPIRYGQHVFSISLYYALNWIGVSLIFRKTVVAYAKSQDKVQFDWCHIDLLHTLEPLV